MQSHPKYVVLKMLTELDRMKYFLNFFWDKFFTEANCYPQRVEVDDCGFSYAERNDEVILMFPGFRLKLGWIFLLFIDILYFAEENKLIFTYGNWSVWRKWKEKYFFKFLNSNAVGTDSLMLNKPSDILESILF